MLINFGTIIELILIQQFKTNEMKNLMNNLMKLTGTDKAYYIVTLIAATILLFAAFLAVLNMIF